MTLEPGEAVEGFVVGASHGGAGAGRTELDARGLDSMVFHEGDPPQVEVRLSPRVDLLGRVRWSDGRPLVGASIDLEDTTPATGVPNRQETLEGKRSIPPGGETDAEGGFTVSDVLQRAYRVRILDPETLLVHISDPLTPGIAHTITLPAAADPRDLEGRVLDPWDRPVEGALVRVSSPGVKRRGIAQQHTTGPIRTDGEGAFEIAGVSTHGSKLWIQAPGFADLMIPVAEAAGRDVRLEAWIGLTLVWKALDAPDARLHAENAAGEPLGVTRWIWERWNPWMYISCGEAGTSARIQVPTNAVRLRVMSDGLQVHSIPLGPWGPDDPGGDPVSVEVP